MQEKTSRVEATARSAGLKMSHFKSKVIKINTKSNADVLIDGWSFGNVADVKYIGSYLTAGGNIDREITVGVVMASNAFSKLNVICYSNTMTENTKQTLCTCNPRSVLLYTGTWRTNRVNKLGGFERLCLMRSLLPVRKKLKELAYNLL
ncbi:hypothetical protein ElyMa_002541700 [Elysia marginata]|uniref:Uncharacterized protein n=1 Tax=Elysia marginata TaxID=1093978 RepID=A0AAV4GXL2_9GAST|nr:hypothetical protein ElyMa_002541700 [Elysia marginata]